MRILVALILLISAVAMVHPLAPDGTPVVNCPVTLPDSAVPDDILNAPTYGDEGLVAGGADNGVMVALRDGNSGGGWAKHGWVRRSAGQLTVTAEPIGNQQLTSDFSVGIPGNYGDSGYQVTAMHFPVDGCWKITGRIPEHSVTFVVWVVFVNDWLDPPGTPPAGPRSPHFA
ncbi:MAG: hypothetical protein M3457_03555 [Chloroflexota bacterium]|nr:hypothetical protein [Chloroflexota bacterium]